MRRSENPISTVINFSGDGQSSMTSIRKKDSVILPSGFRIDYLMTHQGKFFRNRVSFDDGLEMFSFELITKKHLAEAEHWDGMTVIYGFTPQLVMSFKPTGYLSGLRVQNQSETVKTSIEWYPESSRSKKDPFKVIGRDFGILRHHDNKNESYQISSETGDLLSLIHLSSNVFEFYGRDWNDHTLTLDVPLAGRVQNWGYAVLKNWGGFGARALMDMEIVNRELLEMVTPVLTD